jgi:hypothetical protein
MAYRFRERLQCGNLLTQPDQLCFSYRVMRRMPGLHISPFQQLKTTPVLLRIPGKEYRKTRFLLHSKRKQAFEIVCPE